MGERRDRIALILTYAREGAGITWRGAVPYFACNKKRRALKRRHPEIEAVFLEH